MTAAYNVRKGQREDIPALASVLHNSNLFHGDDIRPAEDVLLRDWGCYEVFVAEDVATHSIIGILAGYNTYQVNKGRKRFEIQNLFVVDDWRRHGVGQALVDFIRHTKKAEGTYSVTLKVGTENTKARAAYKKMGFIEKPSHEKLSCECVL